ncbi:MAG: hypothetical protein ACRCT9_02920 [Roseinatronobacter monicus]
MKKPDDGMDRTENCNNSAVSPESDQGRVIMEENKKHLGLSYVTRNVKEQKGQVA